MTRSLFTFRPIDPEAAFSDQFAQLRELELAAARDQELVPDEKRERDLLFERLRRHFV